MAACEMDVRKAILNNINEELIKNRYTFSRISDDTIRINGSQDNNKTKAKSSAQAYEIANSILNRVRDIYKGHVDGYINEPSKYDATTVTFIPSGAYINHELAKYNNARTQGTFFQKDVNTEGLSTKLTTFLNGLNVTTEFKDDLIHDSGYNALSLTDLLYKTVMVRNDFKEKGLTKEAAYVAYSFLGKKNKIRTDLIHSIENLPRYQEIYNEYKQHSPNLSEYKIKELIVVDFLADAIENNFISPKGNYLNRKGEYWSIKGNSSLERQVNYILAKIKRFLTDLISSSKLSAIEVNNLLDDIANDVLNASFAKFGSVLTADQQLTDYEKTIAKDPKAKGIVEDFQQLGFLLTGSLSLRRQGTVYRKSGEDLHDLDFTFTSSKHSDFYNRLVDNFRKNLEGASTVGKAALTDAFVRDLSKNYKQIPILAAIKEKYPSYNIIGAFSGLDGIITITGDIDGYIIDTFFVRVDNIDNNEKHFQDWQPIFKAKLRMGREKDLRDFANYIPYNTINRAIAQDTGFRHFTFRDITKTDTIKPLQKRGPEGSKSNSQTLLRVKEFLSRNGIDVKKMDGEYGDANGVADILGRVINIAEGKEGVALTEEAAHFAVEMIEQTNPTLFNAMLNKISKYAIYDSTIQQYSSDPNYQKDGKPDIRKIKKEAIGKVLAEYIIQETEGTTEKPENIAQVLTWWDQIKNWVKNLLKIAQFNPFQEAASQLDTLNAQDLKGEDGVYLQLSDAQKKISDTFKSVESKIQKVVRADKAGTIDADDEDNNWYEKQLPDGTWKKIVHRVTNRVVEFKENIFGKNKEFTELEKKFYNFLRERGIGGHADMEDIVNRYIDSTTGELKTVPDPRPSTSQIMPNDKSMKAYILMEKYVSKLLNSFEPGSIFLPEQIIYDELYKRGGETGEAGTIDLVVIDPNGKAHIFDWKFMGANNNDDIASWKKGAFDLQIGRYKQILKERYGVKEFGMTRAIPIMMTTASNKTLTGIKHVLTGINVGDVDPKKTESLKLVPIPTADEMTGIPAVDKEIKKLNSLYEKWKKEKPTDPEGKELKRELLNSIRQAVRILQTQQNVEPVVEGAELYLESVKNVLADYEELKSRKKEDLVNADADISNVASNITESIVIADVYSTMGDDLSDLTDDEELKTKLDKLSREVRKTREILLAAKQELVDRFLGERNNVLDITKPETAITGLGKLFNPLSQFDNRALQTLVKIYERASTDAQAKSLKFNREIEEIVGRLTDKKAAYALIFKKDEKGRRVHELIDEFDKEFAKQLNTLKGDKLVDFLKNNIDYTSYEKEAAAKLEEVLDKLDGPNAENRREQQIQRYDPNDPDFTAKNELIWKHIKRDKWESKEFKALSQNKEALELYKKARELGDFAAKIGYIDYNKHRNFIASFKTGWLDRFISTGHISPIQSAIDGLASSDKGVYGVVDDLSGQKRYTIPKYGLQDASKEKIDEKGEAYRDFSDISDDIARTLVGFSMEIYRYEAMNNIVGQVETLRHIEQMKDHIVTNKFGIPLRDEKGDVITEKGNENNANVFEAFEQYLIYGNKYPLTQSDVDTGLGKAGNAVKKLFNRISQKVSGKNMFSEDTEALPSSMIKAIEALNRFTQMKIIGLSPMASIANWFGLQIQAASQGGKWYSYPDWVASEKEMMFGRFKSREEKEKIAQLFDKFLPLVEDPNRHIWKKVGINKIEGNSFQDFLFIGFTKPEFVAQAATFVSLLKNTIVKDGKLRPITDVVREEYAGKDYKEYRENRKDRIEELKKDSVWNKAELKDGKLEIPGFDMNDEEVRRMGLQSKRISKDISGNMSDTDISRASLDVFMRSMMVFKNWIPKLVKTRFGKFEKTNDYYDDNSYDIGKVRLFWHVFMEHLNFRVSAVRGILKTNDKGIAELDKLYTHYQQDYEKRTGKPFNMSPVEFNDMVTRNIANQTREIAILLGMFILFTTIGFMEPPDDPQGKAIMNITKRAIDQMINELSFFYNPVNFQDLLNGNQFPAVGVLSDIEKFMANLASETTGMDFKPSTIGSDAVRKKAQPVKYFFKMVPGIRQGINYMAAFAPNMAKEMDIDPPPAQTY